MEEWRPVVGFEGYYEVSDAGNVRRAIGGIYVPRSRPGRLLNLRFGIDDVHYSVGLTVNRRCTNMFVHSLVAAAFIGPRPPDHDVHHKNENPTDNRPANLEYIDHAEHTRLHNAARFPTPISFSSQVKTRLSAAVMESAKELLSQRVSIRETARRLGVSPSTMHSAIRGRRPSSKTSYDERSLARMK